MRLRRGFLLAAGASVALAAGAFAWLREPPRRNVLSADGAAQLVLMDFAAPMPLDPPPPGWRHRRFWTRPPMEMSFAVKDGVHAIRIETRASASMLFRHVDVQLADYPILAWRWRVERPIDSPRDELTREGDDHPARLFLAFLTPAGDNRRMEIVWGNRLRAGAYKFIGSFPHYVADGGGEHLGEWRTAEVDLAAIYRRLWPNDAPARLVDIALFCDSDDTGTGSVAYFADLRMSRAPAR